jgi:hypothetical protein
MKSDLKTGFWLGLGLSLALAVWGIGQLLLARAAGRG